LRIQHVSDTHGHFFDLHSGCDVVVHSGDLLPNATRGKPSECNFQLRWLEEHASEIVRWLAGRPMLYCAGNHDFLSPEHAAQVLNEAGAKVTNITDRSVLLEGRAFYGFPWCPPITGEWAFETTEDGIAARIRELPKTGIDVFVTHAPPYGILDCAPFFGTFDHIGSRALRNAIAYGKIRPALHLFGHAHESCGLQCLDGILYSNAARTKHIIEI
jgi:Icc-related predicted phosphoesterase